MKGIIALVLYEDSEAARRLEQTLVDYYPIVRIEKAKPDMWYLHLDAYVWTDIDKAFLANLQSRRLLEGWFYYKA